MGVSIRLSNNEVQELKRILDKLDMPQEQSNTVLRIEQDSPSGIGFSTTVVDLINNRYYDITDVSVW